MNYVPYLVIGVLLVGMVLFSQRNRRRQLAAEILRSQSIVVGSEVMTTSGLYATVVARNDEDDTVTLSIAPGVEVKWALAALRDADSLADRYRKPLLDESAQSDLGAAADGREDGVQLDKPERSGPARKSRIQPDEGPATAY